MLIDVSNLDSVKSAVNELPQPIDGLVMNAGGMGGKDPGHVGPKGVSDLFAANLLGHALLVDELLSAKKLSSVAMYAGSEAARGVPSMGMKPPKLEAGSVEEFVSIADMSFFKKEPKIDPMYIYALVKLMGALWMSSMARKHPSVRFITVSPGGTRGTAVMKDLPLIMKLVFKTMFLVLARFGFSHSLEVGAKRYVDAISNENLFPSGKFYASPKKVTGDLVDQTSMSSYLSNEAYQDNANKALHQLIK